MIPSGIENKNNQWECDYKLNEKNDLIKDYLNLGLCFFRILSNSFQEHERPDAVYLKIIGY